MTTACRTTSTTSTVRTTRGSTRAVQLRAAAGPQYGFLTVTRHPGAVSVADDPSSSDSGKELWLEPDGVQRDRPFRSPCSVDIRRRPRSRWWLTDPSGCSRSSGTTTPRWCSAHGKSGARIRSSCGSTARLLNPGSPCTSTPPTSVSRSIPPLRTTSCWPRCICWSPAARRWRRRSWPNPTSGACGICSRSSRGFGSGARHAGGRRRSRRRASNRFAQAVPFCRGHAIGDLSCAGLFAPGLGAAAERGLLLR